MDIVLFGCKNTTLHASKFLFKLGLKVLKVLTVASLANETNPL